MIMDCTSVAERQENTIVLQQGLSVNKWIVSRERKKALFYARSVLLWYSTGVKRRFDEVTGHKTLIDG